MRIADYGFVAASSSLSKIGTVQLVCFFLDISPRRKKPCSLLFLSFRSLGERREEEEEEKKNLGF